MNGALPLSVQNQYIQLATKNNSRFTVVNDYVTANPEEFGLLLTAKEAVNEPVIDIEKKYPEENSSPAEKEKPKKKKASGIVYFKTKKHINFYMQKSF